MKEESFNLDSPAEGRLVLCRALPFFRQRKVDVPNQALARLTPRESAGKSNGRFSEIRELVDLAKQARTWYREHTRWSVSVSSKDQLYDAAHRWFTEGALSERPPRALSARFVHSGNEISEVGSPNPPPGEIELYYDERRERKVTIQGHSVTVSLVKPEMTAGARSDYSDRYLPPDVLHFHATSQEGQQAVVAMLRALAQTKERRKAALHLLAPWGDWRRRDDLPQRAPESVVLVEGQMERLQADLSRFLDQEVDYVRRGLPWHRGYLLHGPPGTGKTSAVRALAYHLNLDLWFAPLGDLQKDASLLQVVNEVRPRSILLLEDIDIFHAARARDDDNGGVTMAGLLNALDGVATPHGLIVFMTTNDMSVIDPALLRPGRIDLTEFLDLPTEDQVRRLWANFYDRPIPEQETISFKGSSADVIQICIQHSDDPEAALQSLTLSHSAR